MSDHRRGTLTQYWLLATALILAAGARPGSGQSRLTDSTVVEVRVLGELEVVGPGGVAIDVAGSRLRRLVTRWPSTPVTSSGTPSSSTPSGATTHPRIRSVPCRPWSPG